MNTTGQEWFSKLERSWKRLCEGFAKREFYPTSENDITCYLYHSLVAYEGVPINSVHTEYAISEGKEVDLVLGINPLQIEVINASLLVQMKLRKRHIDYYLDHYERFRMPSSFYGMTWKN